MMGRFTLTQVLITLEGIILLLVLGSSWSPVQGEQAIFFDEKNYGGNSLTLNISGGCYQFKKKWISRASSIQVEPEACIIAWKNDDCSGQSLKVLPDSRESRDLKDAGFDKKIKSASLCVEISYRPILNRDEVSDRMGNSPDIDAGEREHVEVNFFDEPEFAGSVLTLTLYTSGECYTFSSKWVSKISSIEEVEGNCLKVWDTKDCEGPFIRLTSTNTSPEEFRNLKRIRLDNKIKSIKLCSQHKPSGGTGTGGASKKDKDDGRKVDDSSSYRSGGGGGAPGSKQRGPPPQQPYIPQGDVVSDIDVMEVAMREHNRLRRMHGVPDLSWDEGLQRTAQSYANYLASSNRFEHSKDNLDLGENLAGDSTDDKLEALTDGIAHWYHEINHYNFDNPSRSVIGVKAGHFTQLVWKSTTNLGVGMAWNPKRRWWVIVANYSPAGNFKGEYPANVFPPVSR